MDLGGKFVLLKTLIAQTSEAAPAPDAPLGEAAEGAGEAAQGVTGGLGSMLPMIIAFVAIMYFLMIRPQQKREKERRALLSALAKGDAVVTNGGLCGTIVGLTEDEVSLRVDDGVTMKFVRSAVSQVAARKGDAKN